MTILEICEWLETTAIAVLIQESAYGFPILVGIHILGISLSAGTLLWADLRLLGVSLRGYRLADVYRGLAPWFLTGFGVMIISGAVLFTAFATSAYGNVYFRIKTVAIADVISIATGFVLRLVAGAIAIGVVASSWLLVCSFSLALFLGFGKRRSELALAEQGRVYRPVLKAYTASTLDSAMGISATLTLMCYMLYTIAPETRETHGTANLIYTVPPVFYAMFRFIFKVQDAQGESPEELLLRDRVMLLTAGAWVGLVLLVLKFRGVAEAFVRP